MVDKLFFRGEPMALKCFFKNLPMFCPIFIGSLFYQEFFTKDELDFPLAHGHRSVSPTRLGPSGLVFYFYPLQIYNNNNEKRNTIENSFYKRFSNLLRC